MGLYDAAVTRLDTDYDSRMVGTRYGDTHVLSIGQEDAPPVVVLGGGNFLNPSCLRWFLPLARQHRLYAPDIVGQPGRSAQARPAPGGDGHALWLGDVLDGLGLERAPMVGISYGAGIILRIMGYAPDRAARAALVSPSGIVAGSLPRMLKEVALPMVRYRVSPSRERLSRAVQPLLTEPDEELSRQIGAMYRAVRLDRRLPRLATEQELRGFHSPVLVFSSEHDLFFPGEEVVKRAKEIVPNLATAECLRGCRHVPSAEAFVYINAKIGAFLGDR